MIEYVQPKNRVHAYFKKIVPRLATSFLGKKLIQIFAKITSTNKSPDGFIAEVITDKEKTYGLGYDVNILECGKSKLFHNRNFSDYSVKKWHYIQLFDRISIKNLLIFVKS